MKNLKGNLLIAQSGGPTSVINASIQGVVLEAFKHPDRINHVYGALNGIRGVLDENFIDFKEEDINELKKLKNTPSAAIGSVRYKLKDNDTNHKDYMRLLEVFKKHNIRFFFYNGGNDSMDTANKIGDFLKESNWECNVIGLPKTIDNDLAFTDHCPGYGSAARYIATSVMELKKDVDVYDIEQITVLEVMGRNAGWLTAASALANLYNQGPDLLYLPEKPLDVDKMFLDVEEILKRRKKVFIVVSEGVKDLDGKYIPERFKQLPTDCFGHVQLGGTALILADVIREKYGIKTRSIEFNLLQRCAAHLASKTDINETLKSGQFGLRKALAGQTNKMVSFQRISDKPYKMKLVLVPLDKVANAEKKVPLNWISDDNTTMSKEFFDYALPLIQGEDKAKLENGLPQFAKLKLQPIKK